MINVKRIPTERRIDWRAIVNAVPAMAYGALSGLLLLLISLSAIWYAMAHLTSQDAAVAWALVCGAIIALARKLA